MMPGPGVGGLQTSYQSSSDNSALGRKARTDVTLEPAGGVEI